jgi:hypothetical protein
VEWTFLYMMVFLKLPIVALLWIVWWAIRQEPQPADQPGDGGIHDRPHPPHPRRPPRPPGRAPHGPPHPAAPPRVRTTHARARLLEH